MRAFHYGLCLILFSCELTGCARNKQAGTPQVPQEKHKELQWVQTVTAPHSLDNPTFKKYQQQFSIINNNYEIYKKNQSLIEGNSAEIIKLELNNKINVECARDRSAVFTSMVKRANELNKL